MTPAEDPEEGFEIARNPPPIPLSDLLMADRDKGKLCKRSPPKTKEGKEQLTRKSSGRIKDVSFSEEQRNIDSSSADKTRLEVLIQEALDESDGLQKTDRAL